MKTILAVLILLLSSVANATELDWKWTKADTAIQATWTVLHIVDWSQTRQIAKEPRRFYEGNPILGRHPSVGRVDTYMALSAVANLGVAYALPKPYRRYFQVLSIGITGKCVILNFDIGLGGGDWF